MMSDYSESPPLPVDRCWALLRSVGIGRLAVAVGGRPDIFPVNYVVDHGSIVFRTAEGTKLAAVTVAPQVAFEADGHDPVGGQMWSVVAKGRIREVTRGDELIEADDLPLHPMHPTPKHRFLRIEPDEISGRSFHAVETGEWASPLQGLRRGPHE
jgi:nitroimidazol reductase NimA-like FMN-containing flavoprotein (pyridoxamine 5'-phosphate oxidase superfamily)